METATTNFVGPPGIGIIDLVATEASVSSLNTQFTTLRSRIEDCLAMGGLAVSQKAGLRAVFPQTFAGYG